MTTEDTTPGAVPLDGMVRRLVPERPKWVLYDQSESVAESIASDGATFAGLLLCIWFSKTMGGGTWEFVSLLMFGLWTACRMPWERITRTTKMRTKAEAQAWANSLPEDEQPAQMHKPGDERAAAQADTKR